MDSMKKHPYSIKDSVPIIYPSFKEDKEDPFGKSSSDTKSSADVSYYQPTGKQEIVPLQLFHLEKAH